MPPTTAPTSIGLEEAPAFNKAFCHSVCLSEVVDRDASLTRRVSIAVFQSPVFRGTVELPMKDSP